MILVLFLVTVIVALFALVNPIGALPILISVTDGYTRQDIIRVVKNAAFVEALMLFGFMFLGVYIFQVLGININDFKVAGGVLLFKIIYFNSYSTDIPEKIVVIVGVAVVVLLTYIILYFSNYIFRFLGKTGSLIISRIMGLLLASIAVDFMVTGLAYIVHTVL